MVFAEPTFTFYCIEFAKTYLIYDFSTEQNTQMSSLGEFLERVKKNWTQTQFNNIILLVKELHSKVIHINDTAMINLWCAHYTL